MYSVGRQNESQLELFPFGCTSSKISNFRTAQWETNLDYAEGGGRVGLYNYRLTD